MDVFDLNNSFKDDKFAMIYRGEFNDELTFELMQIQSSGIKDKKSIKKRLSYLIAECFQNIIRHSDDEVEKTHIKNSPILLSRNIGGRHFITTANIVDNSSIEKLESSLKQLGELSQDEIEAAFYEALNENTISEKGGAGLGLIEMARKTKNPIEHDFVQLNDSKSYFILQLQMASNHEDSNQLSLKESSSIFNKMTNRNVVLLRKGDFSQEAILPLFSLFESNLELKEEDFIFKKKSLYVLIEMLQNINRHGLKNNDESEGIFIVTLDESNTYKMETGNYISKDQAIKLERDLIELSKLDKIQLNKKYREQLLSDSVQGEGAGIGIIEMFRNSDGNIEFEFDEVSDDVWFFSFGVTLN